jgi:acid phosphatase type 7
MPRRKMVAGAASLLAVTAAVVGIAPTASAATATFTPAADTYVDSNSPGANFGASGQLGVDNSPIKRTFLKFSVANVSGTVTNVKLRIHADDVSGAAGNNGGTFRSMTNTSWSETGVTYNNQPSIDGATLGSLGSVSQNTWYEIDITAAGFVTGNGTYSIGVTSSSSDGADYDSRETGSTAPQLIITTGAGPSPSPSPTTTSRAQRATSPTSAPTLARRVWATTPTTWAAGTWSR